MRQMLEQFASLLNERLQAAVLTTEDSVRYTHFYALLASNFCNHTDVILELPHPAIPRAKIDTFITANGRTPSIAIEFKYDRPIPSQTNLPRTQKAGYVFNDLFRLARVPTKTAKLKYFVYLTDQEMATYFQNSRNQLNDFFDLPENTILPLTSHRISLLASTFQGVVQAHQIDCSVRGVYKCNLVARHFLRVYEIFA